MKSGSLIYFCLLTDKCYIYTNSLFGDDDSDNGDLTACPWHEDTNGEFLAEKILVLTSQHICK